MPNPKPILVPYERQPIPEKQPEQDPKAGLDRQETLTPSQNSDTPAPDTKEELKP